jgi:hypothetical protein
MGLIACEWRGGDRVLFRRAIVGRSGKKRRQRVVKTVISVVLGVVTAGVGIYLLVVGTSPARSTHHSQIRVALSESSTPETRLAEYDRLVQTLETWAGKADFRRVPPEQTGSVRQSRVGVSRGDVRVTYFREAKPADPSWPIEVMVAFDPDAAPTVEIVISEGYHRGPSPRLQDAHRTLLEHLQASHSGQILSATI